MSQKGEDSADFPYNNANNNNNIPTSSNQNKNTSQTQQHMSSASSHVGSMNIPPHSASGAGAFMPPPFAGGAPYYGWDWWNANYYGAGYDMGGYRDDSAKNQMLNASIPNSKTTPSNLGSLTQQQQTNKSGNPAQTPNSSASQFGPGPFMPYMDPFMYYQMAAAAAAQSTYGFGMNPFHNPYALPGQYGPMSLMNMGPTRMPEDDQKSIQSFSHFDLDTRSEKKLNINQTNRAQSIAGDFKTELIDHYNNRVKNFNNTHGAGLLMEDPNSNLNSADREVQSNLNETTNQLVVKRDENRLTPQLHQLPHVRACFSLNSIVQIRANDPCEGQPALVDIYNLSELLDQYLINPKNVKVITSDDNDDDEDGNELASEMRIQVTINYKLLQEFPGPLVKEHTSKAQIIQFCQKNIKECLSNTNVIDPQSHALLWDYLALLVRQNGIVDLKTDISPLLLSGIADTQNQWTLTINNSSNTKSNASKPIGHSASSASLTALQHQQDFVLVGNDGATLSNNETNENGEGKVSAPSTTPAEITETKIGAVKASSKSPLPQISEEELHLNKLRQLLGAGQKSDAIELAIKYNMWPHALFLATSFNPSTTASNAVSNLNTTISNPSASNTSISITESKILNKVKSRFINSLQPNDPIHTCYQLLLGRIPSVASNVSKSEWNDWRRHLAMIVANVDDNNRDLVLNSIKTMGDSLALNGRVAASHFCYLLADCPFGTFNKKSSKLVLIGSSHNQEFNKFCQINAIQATEIFEFAHSFSSHSTSSSLTSGILENFVKYKLIYASRLLEYGFINEAYKYLEVIAKSININPKLHSDKISSVFQLANRLRIYDPDFSLDDLNALNNEPQWLQELTNNYKKLHLNKLWHLLPSKVSPTISSHEQQDQRSQQDHRQAQIEQPQQPTQSLITTINVSAPKNEPKTAEPSPNNNQYSNQQTNYNAQYSDNSYMNHQLQHQINDLSYVANKLNLNNNNNTNDPSNQQYDQTQYQQQAYNHHQQYQENMQNYQQQSDLNQAQTTQLAYNMNNDYQNNQYYQTADAQQQQAQPQQQQQAPFNPYASTQSRKSSTNSVNPVSNENSNLAKSYPSVSMQNIYNPSQRRPSNSSDIQANQLTRSRNNSSSTTHNDNVFPPFNPYQPIAKPQETSQPSYFDPNANLTKSQTFPSNKSNQIKEEDSDDETEKKTKKKQNYYDDEDEEDLKLANSKTGKKDDPKNKNQAATSNKGWLTGIMSYIKPPNGPKKMVLPDDKKKTIVWDDKLKKYVNNDSNEDPTAAIKPPPTFIPATAPVPTVSTQPNIEASTNSQLQPQAALDPSQPAAPPSTIQNRFSLKSQTNSRRNYYAKVDVMADQSKKLTTNIDSQAALAPMLSNMPPPSQLPPRFFVPEAQTQAQPQQQQAQTDSQPSNNNNNNISPAQQQQNAYYQPQQGQFNNYNTDENDSGTTNSGESYTNSQSSSNESGYVQNNQNYYYDPNSQYGNQQDQYYQHHNI